jgi:hypothetical protein
LIWAGLGSAVGALGEEVRSPDQKQEPNPLRHDTRVECDPSIADRLQALALRKGRSYTTESRKSERLGSFELKY